MKRGKIDPKSIKNVTVGYASNGNRLYNVENRKVITARDVIFRENGMRLKSSDDDQSYEFEFFDIPVRVVVPTNSDRKSDDNYGDQSTDLETKKSPKKNPHDDDRDDNSILIDDDDEYDDASTRHPSETSKRRMSISGKVNARQRNPIGLAFPR